MKLNPVIYILLLIQAAADKYLGMLLALARLAAPASDVHSGYQLIPGSFLAFF